jgi:hypothetical protein
MNIQGYGAVAVILGIITTLFWMIVAWRAMRAHERIADALSADFSRHRRVASETIQKDRRKDEASFREFLESDPIAKHMESSEQIRRFSEWRRQKSESENGA